MITYDIGGVTLADASGRWWVTAEGSSVSQAVAARSVDNRVPGMGGVLASPIPEDLEEATINLRVMVASRDEAVRAARWEAVTSLVMGGGVFTLGRTAGGARRTTLAKLRSISEPELHAGAGAQAGVIALTLLDGVFHSAPVDLTVPLTAAGAVISVPGAAGNAPTLDWWARVNGACTSVSIEPVVQGVAVPSRASGWAGSKTSTQRLFLRRFSAWTAAADTWTEPAAPNQLGAVQSGAHGALALVPEPTGSDPMVRAAKVRVVGAGVTSGTTITIRAGGSWV